MYLIEYGEVTLVKLNGNTKIEIMTQVAGGIVGADILFKNAICDYSALANKSCKLYRITATDFQQILSHQKETSLELAKYFCSLINEMERRA